MGKKFSSTKLIYNAQAFLDRNFSGESIDYRQIIAIFLPILLDQSFVLCLNMVNVAMISSSGVAAVSAVNIVDSLNIFLMNVFIAVSVGGTIVVAQYKGTGNGAMVSKAAASSVSSVFLLALSISLIVIAFHRPVLYILFQGAEADVLSNARIYLIGSCTSYCGFAIREAVCGALRGVGETKLSLVLSLIMNVSYVVLNIILINVLHMGIVGMVISMNISRYLGGAFALVLIVKMNAPLYFKIKDTLHFDPAMLKRIFFIGIPFAAEQMFFNGGKILTQIFIVSLGTYAIATNAICVSITGISQIPATALSLALVTVVGQCMGQRNIKDSKKFIRSFAWLSSFSFLITGLLIMSMFNVLVSLFHPPSEIVPDIFKIMLITSIAQIPLWATSFIYPSALRAAGDSKFTSIVSLLSMWLFRIVLGYLLGIVLSFGIIGFWLAMNCEWGIRGIIFFLRTRGKKWYQHHLID